MVVVPFYFLHKAIQVFEELNFAMRLQALVSDKENEHSLSEGLDIFVQSKHLRKEVLLIITIIAVQLEGISKERDNFIYKRRILFRGHSM